jgi:hypothetical protein
MSENVVILNVTESDAHSCQEAVNGLLDRL